MLEAVDVMPDSRRALRRAVELEAEVVCDLWAGSAPHRATDLSPYGIWLETPFPLERGTEVVLSFVPPRWSADRELLVVGDVRRVELSRRRSDPLPSGMGVAFRGMGEAERDALAETLRGLPPPLPRRQASPRLHRELVWVDMLLTWEEDLGEQLNDFEVSDRVGVVAEHEMDFEPLSGLLTAGKRPYKWKTAA